MSGETYFYSVMNTYCSCRGQDGNLRNLGKLYKTYYKQLKTGRNSIEILNNIDDGEGNIGIYRMCCRIRFLSIPIVQMIDTSKQRIYDDTKPQISEVGLEKILPGINPPELPPLSNKKALRIIPPKIKAEGSLPKGF